MASEPVYVLFAKKGDYRLSIRTPALIFGGANIHIDREDGTPITNTELVGVFPFKFVTPTTNKFGDYLTLKYEAFASTLSGINTSFLDRRTIGFHPELVFDLFETFLTFLEDNEIEVERETGMGVYMDTVKEILELAGFFPPKGVSPVKVEKLSVSVGGFHIENGKVTKD